jgi:hypothetical protein
MKYLEATDIIGTDNVENAKKILHFILYVSVFFEIIYFPSFPNILGCLMSWIVLKVFCILFTKENVVLFPFSFAMYLSMFLYRFLPLTATLMEGKPISYKMELAYSTFTLETLLFLIGSLAFYYASQKRSNNKLQLFLAKQHFYQITPPVLWMMGAIGVIVRLATFANTAETGDVGGKFLVGLTYFQLAPLILFCPDLLRIKGAVNRKFVVAFLILVTILNIASNSREAIVAPLFLLVLLSLLWLIKARKKLTDFISPTKFVLLAVGGYLILGLFSNLSLAMLATRTTRGDISKSELFQETLNVLEDKAKLQEMENISKGLKIELSGNETYAYGGWTEEYLDNFIMNRYANMRVTDITLYYASILGYSNSHMLESMFDQILALLPDPLLKVLKINIDKDQLVYSRGDQLYNLATHSPSVLGGFRVTSHVADGLATFGYWYFPIQFILWLAVFYLLNSFVFFINRQVLYAPFALINLFVFLGRFRNAGGCFGDIGYILRGFWQSIFTYLLVFYICFYVLKLVKNK